MESRRAPAARKLAQERVPPAVRKNAHGSRGIPRNSNKTSSFVDHCARESNRKQRRSTRDCEQARRVVYAHVDRYFHRLRAQARTFCKGHEVLRMRVRETQRIDAVEFTSSKDAPQPESFLPQQHKPVSRALATFALLLHAVLQLALALVLVLARVQMRFQSFYRDVSGCHRRHPRSEQV